MYKCIMRVCTFLNILQVDRSMNLLNCSQTNYDLMIISSQFESVFNVQCS